jgi:subtilisin family serine protease
MKKLLFILHFYLILFINASKNHSPMKTIYVVLALCFLNLLKPTNIQAQTFEVIAVFPSAYDAPLQDTFRRWGGIIIDISPYSNTRLWRFPESRSIPTDIYHSYRDRTEGVDRVRASTTAAVGTGMPIEIVLNRPTLTDNTVGVNGGKLPVTPPFPYLPKECSSLEPSLKIGFGQKRSVTVAFLDTGIPCAGKAADVKQTHPYLSTSDWRDPYNFINKTNLPNDDNGHGTATAGIVWSQFAVNSSANRLNIMPLKVLDGSGRGTLFNLIKAIDYATEKQADIINISIISPDPTVYKKPTPIQYVMDLAKSKNILIVAASGNGNGMVGDNIDLVLKYGYPACASNDNLLVIGASTCNTGIAGFSNYGKKNVDIFAPGKDIRVFWRPTFNVGVIEATWAVVDGTSYATPIVTGIAALMASHQASNNANALKNAILSGSTYQPYLAGKCVKDALVNAPNALSLLPR